MEEAFIAYIAEQFHCYYASAALCALLGLVLLGISYDFAYCLGHAGR
jgi:hypothetical protein